MPATQNTAAKQRGGNMRPPVAQVRVTRLAKMQADGTPVELPEPGPGAYLVSYLMEVGPIAQTGNGPAVVSWSELQAWQEQIGVELQPWEARMVRRLSRDFLVESRRAEAPDALAPMTAAATQERRDSVARRIGLEFGAMARAANKGLRQ